MWMSSGSRAKSAGSGVVRRNLRPGRSRRRSHSAWRRRRSAARHEHAPGRSSAGRDPWRHPSAGPRGSRAGAPAVRCPVRAGSRRERSPQPAMGERPDALGSCGQVLRRECTDTADRVVTVARQPPRHLDVLVVPDECSPLDTVDGLDDLGAIDLVEARQLGQGEGGEGQVGCLVALRCHAVSRLRSVCMIASGQPYIGNGWRLPIA